MAQHTGKSVAGARQLLIFRSKNEEYGLDVANVKEITEAPQISNIPEAPRWIRGVTNFRGQILPVVDLAGESDISSQDRPPASPTLMVIEIEGQAAGLLVDGVPEIVKVPPDNIEPAPGLILHGAKRDYIAGVARLKDRLVILLDIGKVLGPGGLGDLAEVGASTSPPEGR
jgi:purine-binding chemotaxis protein CheW